MKSGTLYLIPSPLIEDLTTSIDPALIEIIHSLRVFVVEKSKTARQYIKSTIPPYTQQEITVVELNKHGVTEELDEVFKRLKKSESVGLISEAGCPGVADPGADIVAHAHNLGIPVRPLIGPSSILLALMASGMNGQKFCFHGYLPQDRTALAKELQRLEMESIKFKQTQIWIETPYRNNQMKEVCLASLKQNTRFCIAADLTATDEKIFSGRVGDWTKDKMGELHKIPAVFLLQA
ncbi:MAG TPA: SAM-dependent methyltransferase [Saprospiraceae bacterium]|nr:SAM-dependent methyltransferase [Saprospiraceae bacterium]